MPYLYYCCIDFDEIWWKDAEDQIFSRYRVQQRALSSKKKFCDFLWKFWQKHPLPGYPKKFLRDGTTRVLFSIKNCTDSDRYQKFFQKSRDHSITLKTIMHAFDISVQISRIFKQILPPCPFLVACTRHYKSLCRSVGPSVGPSVRHSLLFSQSGL